MARKKELQEKFDKLKRVDRVLSCPHCSKLIGLMVHTLIEEVPVHRGDCVDCAHLRMLSEKRGKELAEAFGIEDEKIVAQCEFQGNVNAVMFSQKDLDERINQIADFMKYRQRSSNDPTEYDYYCLAFEPRKERVRKE